jgi:ethanolamine utilization protein EutQ (cupin superfamily)
MPKPFVVTPRDALTTTYDLATDGVDVVSTQLITNKQLLAMGLYHDAFEPPIDYTLTKPQDLIIYQLEGNATFIIEDQTFELAPGDAIFIPANCTFRHTASEKNTSLSFWNPAPGGERAQIGT